jgi:peptidoglycan-associated lipoprotein
MKKEKLVMRKKNVLRQALYVTLAALLAAGCAKTATVPIAAEPAARVTPTAAEHPTDIGHTREPAVAVAPIQQMAPKPAAAVDLQRIQFDFDRYVLTPQARDILAGNAAYLKAHPEIKVVIDGYCDDRGSDEYNLALGERRALAAKQFIISLGVPPESLSTISYGEENPLDAGNHEGAWAKNRRAEFRIISLPSSALGPKQPNQGAAEG